MMTTTDYLRGWILFDKKKLCGGERVSAVVSADQEVGFDDK